MREEKQLLLDDLKDQIEDKGDFVIFAYKGLTANASNDFREEVGKVGGTVEVVPRRILRKAAEAVSIPLDTTPMREQHLALAFPGEDSAAIAKTIVTFGKESGAVEVMGGHFDGQLYSADDVKVLAKLPGKDEVRAQFLGLLEAPMVQTVSTMNALLTSVLYCLEQKAAQGGES